MGLLGKSDPYGGMSSLLGIDPSAMRRQALFNGLAAAGFTLMGDRNPGNAGLAFVAGTDRARDDYMRTALDAYRLKTGEEDRQRQRKREDKQDAWTNTQNQRQLERDDLALSAAPQTESVWNPATQRYDRVQWVDGQWMPLTMPEGGSLNRQSVEEAPMSVPGMEQPMHPLMGQTIGQQDHGFADHVRQGQIPRRTVPGTDSYYERMSGQPYDMSPPETPVPMPRPRPNWGIPGTDSYYENRDGVPLTFDPVSYEPQGGQQTETRSVGGRFGGSVPVFGQQQGFSNIDAEAPAKAPEKMTEGQRRVKLLATQTATQEPIIMENFDSLASLQNIAGANIPLGRIMMTPEGKAGVDSISNVIGNWIYLVSGATATDQEIERRASEVMPAFGDDENTLALKKARLKSYIDGMKEMAGINGQDPAANRRKQLKQKYNLED